MLVGQTYLLNFSSQFNGANGEEVMLDAITSARTLIDFGIDIYTSIFESVGLTRSDYEDWLKGSKLIYTFRKGNVIFKVPSGFFEEADPVSTVAYKQHVIVIELPYLTSEESAAITATLPDVNEFLLLRHGLVVNAVLKPYGTTKDVTEADSLTLQTERIGRKTNAAATVPSVETLKSVNADLKVKLEGLERIIIDRGLTNP